MLNFLKKKKVSTFGHSASSSWKQNWHGPDEEDLSGKAYDARLLARLLPFIKPYRSLFILATILLPFIALAQLIQPYLIKTAIDAYLHPQLLDKTTDSFLFSFFKERFSPEFGIALLSSIFFFFLLLEYTSKAFQLYTMQKMGGKTMHDLRQETYRHICHLPLSTLEKQPVGRLVTRVTNDVDSLSEMFSSGVVSILGDLTLLIGIVGMLLYLHWQLALVIFSMVPFLALLTWIFRMQLKKAFREIRVKIARINAYISEQIGGIVVIKLFSRELQNMQEFEAINADHRKSNFKAIRSDTLLYSTVESFGSIAVGLLIWYGMGDVLKGGLTLGTLVAFIGYIEKFFNPIRDLSAKYTVMQSAMAALERIFGVIDEKRERSKKGSPALSLRGDVDFSRVSFSYDGTIPVISNISFRAKPGEFLALVGATGSGKSTIIKLLAHLYSTYQGTISIDGLDIRSLDLGRLRNTIGYIPQDAPLFNESIAYNISLGANFSRSSIERAASQSLTLRFTSKLSHGLDHIVGEGGMNLSAGQRQLIAFARVLLYNCPILILDEATSNIDSETEAMLQEALFSVAKNRTTLVVAHRLSTVKHADSLLVLHHGEIKDQGTHQELLKRNALYQTLYKLQYSAS